MSPLLRYLTLGLCVLLSACFEVREEIWIDSRGGGRIELDYSVPVAAALPLGGKDGIRTEIDRILQDTPELRLDTLEISETEGELLVHAELSTDSLLSLLELQESEALHSLPAAATQIIGDFNVQRSGIDIDFSRKIDVGNALGLASLLIPAEDKTEHRTTYIIHLPTAAKTHNATRTENDDQTLIWDKTLGESLSSPTEMNFIAPIPLPWGWIVGALLVIVALPIWLIRKRRAKRAAVNVP